MLTLRRAEDRGHADFGWLDSRHTFSFGQYFDEKHMGFGPLRVINEDRVAGGGGFPTHPHKDMEIISYVLDGGLAHKDSLGTGSVIKAGDVQRLSAGTGITHSEFNASETDPVHFLQIWIIPKAKGLPATYDQRTLTAEDKTGQLKLVASGSGRDGSIEINQDVDIFATQPGEATTLTHEIKDGRLGWVQVVRGSASVNGEDARPGDGIAVHGATAIEIRNASDDAELLVFDMTADF
ncbi:MAG: pirin family protein [Pseudomonadota bacterium]